MKWSGESGHACEDQQHKHPYVIDGHLLKLNMRRPVYELFCEPTEGGTVSGAPSAGSSGTQFGLTALPSSNKYTFDSFSVTGTDLTGSSGTFHDSDITARANFIYHPTFRKIGSISNSAENRLLTTQRFGYWSAAKANGPAMPMSAGGDAGSIYTKTTDIITSAYGMGNAQICTCIDRPLSMRLTIPAGKSAEFARKWPTPSSNYNLYFQCSYPTASNIKNNTSYTHPFIAKLMTQYSAHFFKDGVYTTPVMTGGAAWPGLDSDNSAKLLYAPNGWSLSDRAKMVITSLSANYSYSRSAWYPYRTLTWNGKEHKYLRRSDGAEWTWDTNANLMPYSANPGDNYPFWTANPADYTFTNCRPYINLKEYQLANESTQEAIGWQGSTYDITDTCVYTWGADFYLDEDLV